MTDRNRRIIELDEFFDRSNAGRPVAARPAAQSQPSLIAPVGYGPPDEAQLSRMRPGPAGLQGTVIPQSTMDGIPRGTRPHVMQDVVVHIDPHIPGQSANVRLGDVSASAVGRAVRAAEQLTPEPTDIATIRLRGAAVMHLLAEAAPVDMPSNATAAQPVVPHSVDSRAAGQPTPATQQPREQAEPVQQQSRQLPAVRPSRQLSPLAAFTQRGPAAPLSQPVASAAVLPGVPPVGPPQVQVLFEIEHFGSLNANYHDVIIETGFLVLIFDSRHQGSTKYFPRPSPGAGQNMALNVIGTPEVYRVQTTGVQFESDGREFCVLMIDEIGILE